MRWIPSARRPLAARWYGFGIFLLTAIVVPSLAQEEAKTLGDLRHADLIAQGKIAYDNYCSGCHGIDGDGKGPAAPFLDPRPRDLTAGVFKFRSTPSGSLPTDADLHRTLTQGVHGTSMPSWYLMPDNQRSAVVEYLKSFSDEWNNDYNYEPAIALPGSPSFLESQQSAARGKEIYAEMACSQCHGETGVGDGPAAATLTDDWGVPIKPFDFTSGALKSGTRPEDIYRAFSTGLNGTPMPDYSFLLTDDDRWHLVSYILELRSKGGDAR